MKFPFLNIKYFFSAILWLIFSCGNLLFSQEKKDTSAIVNTNENSKDTSVVKQKESLAKDSTSGKNLAFKFPSSFKMDSIANLVRLDSSNKKKLLKKKL